MDYGRIVNRAFEIAWKYKWLWVFGMFTASSFNIDINYLIGDPETQAFAFQNFDFAPEILLSFAFALIMWILVMIILYIVSEIAIIDSVNRIERGGKFSFSIAFSAGLDHFFRFLGLNIVLIFAIIVSMMILILMIVLLFAIHVALGIVSLLIFIPLFFLVIFLFTNISQLAKRALIVRSCSIGDALNEGYYLLKTYFGKNAIIFGINLGFGIAFSIVLMIIFLMIGLPIGFFIASFGVGKLISFFLAFLLALPISFIFGGFMGVFFSALYTLFYFELVDPKSEQEQLPGASPILPSPEPLA